MALIDELKDRHYRQTQTLLHVFDEIKEREDYRARVEQELDDLVSAIAALTPAPIVNTDEGWELEPSPAEVFEAEKAVAREQLEREPEIPEGWTSWGGGQCPVDPDAEVKIMFMDGCVSKARAFPASYFNWLHDESCAPVSRIYAYRFAEQASVQSEPPVSLPAETEMASVPGAGEEIPDQFETTEPELPDFEAIRGYPANEREILDQFETTDPEQNDYDSTGIMTEADLQGIAAPNPHYLSAMDESMLGPRDEDASFSDDPPTEGYAPVTNPDADTIARAHEYYSPENVEKRNKFSPWGIFKRETEEVS